MTNAPTAPAPPAPAVAPADSPPPLRTGYRPHLDGVRTLAVYLVLAFHAGITRFEGGYIGVDLFFVLSGYLVTQLLVRDLRTSGRIDLVRFYARRFRRLLPAAFAVLLVTAAVYHAIATPAEVLDAFDAIRSSFLYSANWFFLGHATDYFGADINASPVLHYWSLAVEEQFYLTWPLLLFGLYAVARRAGPRRWTVVRGVIAAGALVSLALAFQYARTDVNRAYFGTDARAYQLLAGALLALTPQLFGFGPRARLWLQRLAPVAFLALVVLATSAVGLGPVGRGFAATIAAFTLLLALENAEGGIARRALSLPPIVYLGRISYGTYLWQWPVILVATKSFGLGSRETLLIGALVATALASLSYQLLEQPIRGSKFLDRYKVPVVAVGLAATVVGALVLLPAVLDRDSGSAQVVVAEGTATGATPVPADLDWRGARLDRPDFPDCTGRPVSACTITHGTGTSMLLVGDSHARMLLPAFEEYAKEHSIELSAAVWPVCPWQQGLFYAIGARACTEHKDDWYQRLIPRLDPDIVVLAERSTDDPVEKVEVVGPDRRKLAAGTPELETTIRETSAATVERLRADGRTVIIVEPVPVAPAGMDPVQCLSAAEFLDQCRYLANLKPTEVEQGFRSLATPGGVYVLDLDKWVCPYLPICDPVVDGRIVKRDVGHLTGAFSASLADDLAAYMQYTGVVPKE
jgi:peptidoglycan/LPS O-acetylase OafA/YrhL